MARGEKLATEHKEQHDYIESRLDHFAGLQVVLAKSVYDNFVDRGLIENNDDFQNVWFDFYFNNGKLNIDNAPEEYKTILAKVVRL